jgi:predicted RNA-binding Zn ribbon-like protein
MTDEDRGFLLALLNSTPVLDGTPTDALADEYSAERWLSLHKPGASVGDWAYVRHARSLLQDVVRGERPVLALDPLLEQVVSRPTITPEGVHWSLDANPTRALVAEAVLTWDHLQRTRPGRLRACGNHECALFLLDSSRANTARWCSMATCGNKLKARRHYQRARQGE